MIQETFLIQEIIHLFFLYIFWKKINPKFLKSSIYEINNKIVHEMHWQQKVLFILDTFPQTLKETCFFLKFFSKYLLEIKENISIMNNYERFWYIMKLYCIILCTTVQINVPCCLVYLRYNRNECQTSVKS